MERSVQVQGVEVPRIGLGTWDLRGEEAERAMASALELGYRHFDTAEMYLNERELGSALGRSPVPREDIFLVSKVWTDHLRAEQVVQACHQSLERLQTDYLDLYLVHWPTDRVPIEETMEGMVALVEEGAVRSIGVSNFSVAQFEGAREATDRPLLTDQVRFHPGHRQDALVKYAQEQDVLITAYTPLARGRLAREPLLKEIGLKHEKTPVQVALRWLLQQGKVAAIPKASGREHQGENLAVFDFSLDEDDLERIDGMGR